MVIAIIFCALCLASCNQHSQHWDTLVKVDSYIEEKPDCALVVLQQIKSDELPNKEERARYALMLSIAMDRNFIDKTDFTVLQPAIDYYRHNGSATDKLRTYYYQGRIYHNTERYDLAMQSFVNALSVGESSDDTLTKARILFTQGRLYSTLFEWDKCVETYSKAADLFKSNGKTDSYINCISSIINVCTITEDTESAEHYISLALENVEGCSMRMKGYFYANYLTYIVKTQTESKDFVLSVLDNYLNTIDATYIDWLSVTSAYLSIGDATEAQESILRHKEIINTQQEVKYLALLTDIHKLNGDFQEAMRVYDKYVALTDSLEYAKAKSDTQFIEERLCLEMQNLKEKERTNKIIFVALIFAIISLSVLIIIRYRLKVKTIESELAKQEKEKYRLLYKQIEKERDSLTELLEHNKELNSEAKKALLGRVSLLNRFFMASITDNHKEDRKINSEIEKLLANKEVFMTSTRLAFAGSHPKFIKHLESCGLNEWEINYCCLYALGLKGNEIGEYIQLKSHFNNSVVIRKKLGLGEQNIHLGTYIRNLLKEE